VSIVASRSSADASFLDMQLPFGDVGRMKVAAYRFKSREKPLGLPWRFKAPHPPLPHSGRPMRVLRSIVQTLVLPVFNAWNQFFLSRPIASQFVGDNGSASFFRQRKEVKGAIEIGTPECQDLRYALRFPSGTCDLNAFINLLDPRFD